MGAGSGCSERLLQLLQHQQRLLTGVAIEAEGVEPFGHKPLLVRRGGGPLWLSGDRIPQGPHEFQALGQGQAQQV